VAGSIVQELDDRIRHGVGVRILREQVGKVRHDRHVEPGPRRRLVHRLRGHDRSHDRGRTRRLVVQWARPQLHDVGPDGRRPEARGIATQVTPPARRFRPALGLGQEPLEVTQAVATVTAVVDTVEAEAALCAPGADGVRVDAEDARCLRDRERCIRGTPGERHGRSDLLQWRIRAVLGSLADLPFPANRRKVRGARPARPCTGRARAVGLPERVAQRRPVSRT
jgi:hypothetical protein